MKNKIGDIIRKITQHFDYYKIEDLSPVGNCGLCGKVIHDEIFILNQDLGYGICKEGEGCNIYIPYMKKSE